MPSRVGVAEFVEKPAGAVRPVRASIDFDRSVLKSMFHDAMTAVEFAAVGHGLELFEHGSVRSPRGAWKQRGVGTSVFGSKSLKHGNELLWNRNFAFLPILGMKSPMRFRGDAHGEVFEIDVAPCDEATFGVTEA